MNNMAIYRLAVLCLVVIVPVTLGCTCSPRTNRQKFCDADFVAVADVLGQLPQPDPMTRVYSINALYFWKPPFVFNIDMSRVYTASQGATCGIQLIPGQRYLLSGQLQNIGIWWKRMRVNLCGWNQPWFSLNWWDKWTLFRRGPCTNFQGPQDITSGL